jgi:DNA polymerase sigma
MLNIENTYSTLREIIGLALPGVEFDLLIYGSAVNGLGVRSGESDLDLSLLVKSTLNEDDLNL